MMKETKEAQSLRRLMRELELLDNLDKTLAWDMRVVRPGAQSSWNTLRG